MDTFNYEFNKLRAGSLFKYNNEYFLVLGYDSKYIQEDLSIICISSVSKYTKTFMDFNIMNVSRIFVFDNTVGLYNGFLYKNLTIDYNFFSLDTMNNYLLKLKMLGNDYVTSIIKTLEMKMYIVNTFYKDKIYLDIFKIIPFTDFSGTFYRYKRYKISRIYRNRI